MVVHSVMSNWRKKYWQKLTRLALALNSVVNIWLMTYVSFVCPAMVLLARSAALSDGFAADRAKPHGAFSLEMSPHSRRRIA